VVFNDLLQNKNQPACSSEVSSYYIRCLTSRTVSAGVGRCRNVSYQSGPTRPSSKLKCLLLFCVETWESIPIPETSNNNTEENPAVSESFVQSWSIRLAVIVCGGLLETSFPPLLSHWMFHCWNPPFSWCFSRSVFSSSNVCILFLPIPWPRGSTFFNLLLQNTSRTTFCTCPFLLLRLKL
jgi:hypothetical protein